MSTIPNILFPALPRSPKVLHPFWEKEANAAKEIGFNISIIKDQGDAGALSITNKADAYLYRGWTVKLPYYQEMAAVAGSLFTGYDNYHWTFDFPKWYEAITDDTPPSFIFPADDIARLGLEEIARQLKERVGSKSLIVKDYLKSRKHEWFDACYIKDASDTVDVVRVMSNFFRLQGSLFYGGLVFREFLDLKKLGTHPKSGMPLPIEFRAFFLNQEPLITTMYWDNDLPYPKNVEPPPQAWLKSIGSKMRSPFVALDIAQSEDGKWWAIEVNDGGSAGYPEHLDPKVFYGLLYEKLKTAKCPDIDLTE